MKPNKVVSINPNTEDVTEADLNEMDQLNTVSSLSYRGSPPTRDGQPLKGALAVDRLPFKAKVNLSRNNAYKYKNNFVQNVQSFERFKWFLTNRIVANMYQYENLPKEIDVIGYERKLIQNGSVFILKDPFSGKFLAVVAEGQKWDIYNNPTQIRVVEPLSTLNNAIIEEGNFVEIKANSQRLSITLLYSWIIEKLSASFHRLGIEIFSTLPKFVMMGGFHDLLDNFQTSAENQEQFMKSSHLMASYVFDLDSASHGTSPIKEQAFVDLTAEDRRAQSNATHEYLENMYKDCLGITQNGGFSEKERTTTEHVESAQGINEIIKTEGLICRELGWDKANELFGCNVQVIDRAEQKQKEEQAEQREHEIKLSQGGSNE